MALIINGVELKIDDASAVVVGAELKRLADGRKDAESKVAELQAAAGAAAVEAAALKSRADAAEERVAKLDRADLEAGARVALGAEFKFDGLTDDAVRVAVVAKVIPDVRLDGVDAAFVRGAYATALALSAKSTEQLKIAAAQSGERKDSTDKNDPARAREEMIAARRDAAK